MEIIKPGQYVEATYDLYVGENNEQELMEKATKENPLKFVFGTDQMLPAFEEKLKGLKAGDKFDFIIPCNDAYGEYDKDHVLELGKEIFEVNGVFDKDMIYEGNTVPMMDSNGNRLNGSVLEVKEDIVVMDFNWYGKLLLKNFILPVVAARVATATILTVIVAIAIKGKKEQTKILNFSLFFLRKNYKNIIFII